MANELKEVQKALYEWASTNPDIDKVYIYGSRVAGNFTDSSDLDIAVEIDPQSGGQISAGAIWVVYGTKWERELQSLLPHHKIHLEHYDKLYSQRVKKGVETSGKLVYTRGEVKL